MMQRSGAPRRYPDPLDMPSFELQDDRGTDELPAVNGETPPGAGAPAPPPAPSRRVRRRQHPRHEPPTPPPRRARCSIYATCRSTVAATERSSGSPSAGTPARVAHYALSDPGRYVLDVYGAERRGRRGAEPRRRRSGCVRRVRVARHDGRMRLVLDLGTARPPAYVLERRDGTIALEVGTVRAQHDGTRAPAH